MPDKKKKPAAQRAVLRRVLAYIRPHMPLVALSLLLSLVSVALTSGHDDILIASHDGQAIRFGEEEAREMGRSATGVIGIRLAEGDYVAGAVALKEGDDVLTVTENGYGKRTAESQFPKKHRAGGGVICHDLTDKPGKLAGVLEIAGEGDLLIIASDGQVLRADAADVRVCGRSSQGVILLRAAEDTRVIDVAFIEKTEDASEDEAAAELPAEELPDAAQELPVPEPADEGDGE